MFRRERSIPLRDSAAALSNNLSVLQLPARDLTHFGVVHGPSAQILSAAPEGVPLAQRQLQVKVGVGVSPPLITQVRLGVKEALPKSALPLILNPYLSPRRFMPSYCDACTSRSTGASSPSEYCWCSPHIEGYR